VPDTLPVFTSTSVIAPLPEVLPVIGPLTELVHVYVVPPMLEVGVKFNAVPLQIVVCNCVAVLVMTGTGLTVTVTSKVLPLQPFAVGVIR
jgi:hypothetical protein